jgi:hypothetical protein
MQFGRALSRVLEDILDADPTFGPVHGEAKPLVVISWSAELTIIWVPKLLLDLLTFVDPAC